MRRCRSLVGAFVRKSIVPKTSITSTYQINRTEQEYDGTKNSEMRTADSASDYKATLEAFKGADAVIHLAAIPNPEGQDDYIVLDSSLS